MRIALAVAALNKLYILTCNSKGDYLTIEFLKRIYTIARYKFGSEEGVIMIVKKALYGLKSSGAYFRAKLARVMHGLNYQPTKGNSEVWLRAGTKSDGTEYW